jgi:O-acetyl-ADP-ribose deacetylase (regulator of RNase III)
MRIADDLKSYSIAFPAISTGIFGYPVEQAAWVAVPTIIQSLRSAKCLVFVSMVLFDKVTLDAFVAVAKAQRKPASGRSYEIGFGIINE